MRKDSLARRLKKPSTLGLTSSRAWKEEKESLERS
jgi:hypothetical protein